MSRPPRPITGDLRYQAYRWELVTGSLMRADEAVNEALLHVPADDHLTPAFRRRLNDLRRALDKIRDEARGYATQRKEDADHENAAAVSDV